MALFYVSDLIEVWAADHIMAAFDTEVMFIPHCVLQHMACGPHKRSFMTSLELGPLVALCKNLECLLHDLFVDIRPVLICMRYLHAGCGVI